VVGEKSDRVERNQSLGVTLPSPHDDGQGVTQTKIQTVLEVRDLRTQFDTQDGVVHAVNGVSFDLRRGEFLGIVGESGSGKSVTMMSLLRLIPMPPGEIVSGEAMFGDVDLLSIPSDQLRKIRGGKIGFIFQDPMTSLNPVLTVGYQITESLRLHTDLPDKARSPRAKELLDLVGIPDAEARLSNYPHELSGGMRQRVMIAIALACDPEILVADEPTTALDVTIQAQIIEIIRDLREKLGTAVIWITHDLGVVAGLADRVIVMYGGEIMEEAAVGDLYSKPLHPYTEGLLGSLPRLDQKGEELTNIKGTPPNMYQPPASCPFAPRCPYVMDKCRAENPPLLDVGEGRKSSCWWDLENGRPRYGD
jgi:oligopeptide transport system ATP-binding protein